LSTCSLIDRRGQMRVGDATAEQVPAFAAKPGTCHTTGSSPLPARALARRDHDALRQLSRCYAPSRA
ncbi:MAG: hypothetical protein ACRDST_21960, partial [Pseudonocardiaceae bacterium]